MDSKILTEELILHSKINAIYDPRICARRRRIEWPTADVNIRDIIISDQDSINTTNTPISEISKALAEQEMTKCDVRRGLRCDLGVYDELFLRNPNLKGILRNLYWRARRQSALWGVFQLLVDGGFVDSVCLLTPVDLMSSSHDTYIASCLLHCFTLVCLDGRDMVQNMVSCQGSSWSADIDWLATMIIRSGTQLPKLFETIHASGILGPCMEEEPEQFMNSGLKTTISQNPQEQSGVLEPDGYPVPNQNYFGFWLPHGLDVFNQVEQIKRCLARFNRIETAFREVEEIL